MCSVFVWFDYKSSFCFILFIFFVILFVVRPRNNGFRLRLLGGWLKLSQGVMVCYSRKILLPSIYQACEILHYIRFFLLKQRMCVTIEIFPGANPMGYIEASALNPMLRWKDLTLVSFYSHLSILVLNHSFLQETVYKESTTDDLSKKLCGVHFGASIQIIFTGSFVFCEMYWKQN